MNAPHVISVLEINSICGSRGCNSLLARFRHRGRKCKVADETEAAERMPSCYRSWFRPAVPVHRKPERCMRGKHVTNELPSTYYATLKHSYATTLAQQFYKSSSYHLLSHTYSTTLFQSRK